MIIKTLSRKKPSFFQLYDYIREGCDDKEFKIVRNIINPQNRTQILQEFTNNYKILPARKDGNSMYHDIISLPHNKEIPVNQQKEILYDIANKYLQSRAEHNMAIGFIHEEKQNLHCHLMISSNPKYSDRRHRINKGQLKEIQQELELYKIKEYPELGQELIYTKERKPTMYRSSISKDREYRQQHRTQELSRAEQVRDMVNEVMSESYSKKQLHSKLKKHHLEIYERGKTTGIIDLMAKEKGITKYRYRLKRLGLENVYENFIQFDKSMEIERRKEELEQVREQEIEDRELDDDFEMER